MAGPMVVTSEPPSRSAVLSDCETYRYRLGRRWSGGLPGTVAFVMLNPSTADAEVDDPTIRRCVGFAQREGLEAIDVVNLYAYRATKPRHLAEAVAAGRDVVGPENQRHLREAIAGATLVVFAWGGSVTQGPYDWRTIVTEVYELAADLDARPLCLGRTKDGHPRHPLYVKGDTPLESATLEGAYCEHDASQGERTEPPGLGYVGWHDWAQEMMDEGWTQRTCRLCGLYSVWRKK